MARTVKLLKNGADPTGAPDFTLPVSIIAQVIPQLDVNIAAQSIPTLNVNLSSVGDVTLNVTITGTPTINVQTSGGANIVIDKLTQGAYTERQSTLANNGTTASLLSQNSTYKRGKFFPRGCRGFINTVEIYCDNTDSVSHTFTIKLSPMPGMGAIATYTITVPAGSSVAWRAATVKRFWNYDSLFIWVSCDSDTFPRLGYDAGAPYDYYESTDEVSWSFINYRYWFRVNFSGETVGDLPVSGVVNNIEVPSASSYLQSGSVSVPNRSTTSLLTVYGSGKMVEARVSLNVATAPSSTVIYWIYIYCDGVIAYSTGNLLLTQSETATSGRSSAGEFVQASGVTYMSVRVPLEFRRSIELRVYQSSGSTADVCYGHLMLSLKQ